MATTGRIVSASTTKEGVMVRALEIFFFCSVLSFVSQDVASETSEKIRDLFHEDYDAMFYGTEKNSAAGFSVLLADLNGDTLSDLVVAAPYSDARFKKKIDDAGVTYVYFGRKTLEKTVELGAAADVIIIGAGKNDNSGFALASGDLNGDGIEDLLIGAPLADSRLVKKRNDSGITYVVFGRREFHEKLIDLQTGMADAELHSTVSGEYTGSALAAGDVNGDGLDDVLIGGPFADERRDDSGTVYVLCGSPSLSGSYDLTKDACATLRGQNEGDRLGMAMASTDLNGDTIDDLVLGALETDSVQGEGRNVGRVTVVFGAKDLRGALDLEGNAGFALWGSNRDDYVGSSLAVGDVNGDGIGDLTIGIPYADRNPPGTPADEEEEDEGREKDAGKALVFFGGARFSGEHYLREGGDVTLRGAQGGTNYGDHAGGAVAVADVNGDGFGDVIIAAPLADIPERVRQDEADTEDVGAVFIAYGVERPPTSMDLEDAFSVAIYGSHPNDFFGGLALTKQRAKDSFFGGLLNTDIYRKAWQSKQYDRFFSKSVAAGDFNGDGVADLCIGAPTADGPGKIRKIDDAGAVYLIWGHK
jgi:hypothetical protein